MDSRFKTQCTQKSSEMILGGNMALIRCPECGTEVSEQAKSCPKCKSKTMIPVNSDNGKKLALEKDPEVFENIINKKML
jgi:Zn finger protein HypA/HybF involved in hydrogenase expression